MLAEGPDTAAGHHLLGLARGELDDFAAAVVSFEHAVALNPNAAGSWSNLGMMRKVEGRFPEAIEAHDRAVGLAPDNHRFRVNRAVALLKMGAWTPAWQDYEARLVLAGASMVEPERLMPSLPDLGQANTGLAGVTIVALHEDGFGDTLQFLRYLPLLAELGARVVACVPPALERMMRLVPGVAEVINRCGAPARHTILFVRCSACRGCSRTTVETIPPAPHLMPDAALVQRWAERLPTAACGSGWCGPGRLGRRCPGFTALDRRRSAGLAAFAPLFDVPGVAFVSLQAGPRPDSRSRLGLALADPMPDVVDFADTAAIIAGLDVVVSVDTSVVHLAGLIGKPVLSAGPLRRVLALAERADGQPVVSIADDFPPVAPERLG